MEPRISLVQTQDGVGHVLGDGSDIEARGSRDTLTIGTVRKIGDAPLDTDRPVLEFRSRRAPGHGPVAFNPKRQNRWIPAGVLDAPPQLLGLHSP